MRAITRYVASTTDHLTRDRPKYPALNESDKYCLLHTNVADYARNSCNCRAQNKSRVQKRVSCA